MKDTLECYKVLDLEPGASAERVRRAYRDLLLTWDPDRYVGNPLLQDQAAKKRAEIEEAFQAIRFFLPDLQSPPKEDDEYVPFRATRDFKELERQTVTEKSKAFLGVLVAIALFAVFAWAIFLLVQGRSAANRTGAPTTSEPLEQ